MARNQARIYVTIWNNPEWRALTRDAQWLYETLLSQSRLSLAGCIDLMPDRWAALAHNTSTADIHRFLAELEGARFVAVDWVTGEVVIRTFAVHDVATGALNQNLIKGFWTAWAGILSGHLRQIVVDNVPARIWTRNDEHIPAEARERRTSPRLELPFQQQSERQSPEQSEPNASFSASVTTTAATAVATEPAHDSEPGGLTRGDDDPQETMRAAARILAELEADRRGTAIANRAGYIHSRLVPIRLEHEARWREALRRDPTVTANRLAGIHAGSPTPPDPDFAFGTGSLKRPDDYEPPPDWTDAAPPPQGLTRASRNGPEQ